MPDFLNSLSILSQPTNSTGRKLFPTCIRASLAPVIKAPMLMLIHPELVRSFSIKLVRFAVSLSAKTSIAQQLTQSLEHDLFRLGATVQTGAPAEIARLPHKEVLLNDLAGTIRDGKLASVIFIDLDGFKQVNDNHGHSEGDKCLVEVAATIGNILLGNGRLYRVGGDEFCVFLPNFSTSEAAATAERVRAAVAGLGPFGGTARITTSIGVAASDGVGLGTAESTVNAADEAMYISKWTTKNRVTTWPPPDFDVETARLNRSKAAKDETR
jgi:diguanylate cyclase (GGDEF)-like protein